MNYYGALAYESARRNPLLFLQAHLPQLGMGPHPLHPITLCLITHALGTPPKLYLKHLVVKDPLVVEMRSRKTELHKARGLLRKMYKFTDETQIYYTLQPRYTI